jgi:hypothetical protein
MRLFAVVALSGLVSISYRFGSLELAHAQQARPLRPGEGFTVRQGVHKKGVYGGVQPGKPIPKVYEKKRPVKNKARRKNRVTWVGFQPNTDGRARVFVQLTSDVGYTQRVDGDTLIVSLDDARFGARNARRFLDTRFFDTAVARVDADRARIKGKRRRARGIEVRIKFKNPADAGQASASMAANDADGYTYLFLDFGKPSGASNRDRKSDKSGDDDDGELPEGISDSGD